MKIKREKVQLVLNKADQIKIFQDYVRGQAERGEETTEYPTDLLVDIADALDHVRIAGNPGRSLNDSLIEVLKLKKARLEYKKMRAAGLAPEEALGKIARSQMFKGVPLKTLRSRLLRRKYR
jgi:hypothetical protein